MKTFLYFTHIKEKGKREKKELKHEK